MSCNNQVGCRCDKCINNFRMSPGEKMVWAAVFAKESDTRGCLTKAHRWADENGFEKLYQEIYNFAHKETGLYNWKFNYFSFLTGTKEEPKRKRRKRNVIQWNWRDWKRESRQALERKRNV